MSTKQVIFVCSANICRSPMAEVLAEVHFEERGIPVKTTSMGTLGIQDRKAESNSIRAIEEIGLNLDGHRSQGLQQEKLDAANWIVVMEPKHADSLLDINTGYNDRIVRLWEYVEEDIEGIPDPVSQDIEAFRTIRERINEGLKKWIDQIAKE